MTWKYANHYHTNKILGITALVTKHTQGTSEPDLILSGKYGCIWKYSDDKYYVMFDSPAIGNKYFNYTGQDKMVTGDEVGILVDEKEAKKCIKLLKIPNRGTSQLKYMEARGHA